MEKTTIDKRYVIDLLQIYKFALIKELGIGRNIHLEWLRNKKMIDYNVGESSHNFYRDCKEDQLFKDFARIKSLIEPSEACMAEVTVQYAGGMVLKVVEEWLSWLEPREAETLFWLHINHDFHKKHGRFETLSYQTAADKMAVDRVTVWRKEKSAISKIIDLCT